MWHCWSSVWRTNKAVFYVYACVADEWWPIQASRYTTRAGLRTTLCWDPGFRASWESSEPLGKGEELRRPRVLRQYHTKLLLSVVSAHIYTQGITKSSYYCSLPSSSHGTWCTLLGYAITCLIIVLAQKWKILFEWQIMFIFGKILFPLIRPCCCQAGFLALRVIQGHFKVRKMKSSKKVESTK